MSATTARVAWNVVATEAGIHSAAGAGAVVLTQRDDADSVLPSTSNGKGRVKLQRPLGFPGVTSEGRRVATQHGAGSLATSSPDSASAD